MTEQEEVAIIDRHTRMAFNRARLAAERLNGAVPRDQLESEALLALVLGVRQARALRLDNPSGFLKVVVRRRLNVFTDYWMGRKRSGGAICFSQYSPSDLDTGFDPPDTHTKRPDQQAELRELVGKIHQIVGSRMFDLMTDYHIGEMASIDIAAKYGFCSVRADDFSCFLAQLAGKGRAPRTLNRYHETLRNFLRWCVRMGWLEQSPIARLPMTRVGQKGRRRRRRAYTVNEWHRLMAAVSDKARIVYQVASLSGFRRSELKKLEKRDIQPMRWTVRAEVCKNGQAANLPMLPECWELLEPIWSNLTRPTDLAFAAIPVIQTLRGHLAAAGIDRQDAEGRWVDFHSFRYFFCTLLARELPIQVVRLLMRHSTIQLTAGLYLDLGLSDVAEATLKLPRLLSNKKQEGTEPNP